MLIVTLGRRQLTVYSQRNSHTENETRLWGDLGEIWGEQISQRAEARVVQHQVVQRECPVVGRPGVAVVQAVEREVGLPLGAEAARGGAVPA